MVGSILSAVLLILAFPNYNLWLLAWFGFVPLFFTLRNKSKGRAFLVSYLMGVIFWFGTIYWLVHVTFLGMILLVLYLALYFGIFGLMISCSRLIFMPAIWVLLEYLRSHLFTGFPWALLGYSQYLNLPVIQIADITGVWGVSLLVMMVNTAIYSVVSRKSSGVNKKLFLPILGIVISLGYGYYKISQLQVRSQESGVKISVIQGNIPQELKWEVNSREFIIAKYFNLTKEAVKDKPDLIIWPEAALPVTLEEEPVFFEQVKNFVKETNIPLFFGAVTYRNRAYYNSALLLSGKADLLNRYDKLHLVPFGEYIPLRRLFAFLETVVPIGDFAAGKDYTVFELSTISSRTPIKFSVLICFEDLFPQISREFSKRGNDFLVNITNDAWFGRTSSPYQHLQASVFRAVENRLPLVRAANTGVSGFIAPSGKIMALVRDKIGKNIFIGGYKTQELLIPKRGPTFYTRYGEVFIMGCFLWVLYGIISPFKKRR